MMKIDLPLIESKRRRVDFDEGYRIEIEHIYLDAYDDVIIIRSESTTYFFDQNIPTHYESHIHRTSRYRKDQEKVIMMEIEKLAKGTNRATEKSSLLRRCNYNINYTT